MKEKAETAVVPLLKQGSPKITHNPSEANERQGQIPHQISEEAQLCRHLDFGLLASSTVRQYISVVLSNPGCGTL